MKSQTKPETASVRQKHANGCSRNFGAFSCDCGLEQPVSVEPEAAHTPTAEEERRAKMQFASRLRTSAQNLKRVTAQRDALLAAAKDVLQAKRDEATDGLDRSQFIIERLKEPIAQAEGKP